MKTRLAVTAGRFALAALVLVSCLSFAAPQQMVQGENETKTIEIRLEHRQVVGDKVIRVTHGELIKLVWTSDEATELHIHGYDIRIEVSPKAPVEVTFSAHATGRFAVTSHGYGGEHDQGHDTLLYLEVHPQ